MTFLRPRPSARRVGFGCAIALSLLVACGDDSGQPALDDAAAPNEPDGPDARTPEASLPSDRDAEAGTPEPDARPDAPDAKPDVTVSCLDGDRDGELDATCGGTDCDDEDPAIHPGAPELCGNAADDDCDPETLDEFDADGDGVTCVLDCDDGDETKPDDTGGCKGSLYVWDFEGGPAGWEAAGDNGTWALVQPAGVFIRGAGKGQFAWVTELPEDGGIDDEMSWLTSPSLDMSELESDPVLMFSMIRDGDEDDYVTVQVSIDGGAFETLGRPETGFNWFNRDDLWNGRSGDEGDWHTAFHRLAGVKGEPDVRIRFVLTSGFRYLEGTGIDDVRIVIDLPDIAVQPIELVGPRCEDRPDSVIKVDVINTGNRHFDRVRLGYTVDDREQVVEEFAVDLAPGDTEELVFTTHSPLAEAGEHHVQIAVAQAVDFFAGNDEASGTTVTLPTVGPDFVADFEGGSDGFHAHGSNSSWGLGAPEGTYITSAASGEWAFTTHEVLGEEASYLQSPCYDFSELEGDPVLAFSRSYDMLDDGYNFAYVEVSLNGGNAPWELLGAPTTGSGWYEHARGWAGRSSWTRATHRLPGAGGQPYVTFRVAFVYDHGYDRHDFGLDDVSVFAPPLTDLAVERAYVRADVGCSGRTGDHFVVEVWNRGTETVNGFDVSYAVGGRSPVVEHVADALAPDTLYRHTFVLNAELAAIGEHTVVAKVSARGDAVPGNDTFEADSVTQQIFTGVGYERDFEADDGGWEARGFRPSWVREEPEGGTYIDHTPSGTHAWMTGTGLYTEVDERSTLNSPCFDFRSVSTDPTFQFAHIYSSDFTEGRAWLEISLDGGNHFTKVGTNDSESGVNWYDDITDDTWSQTPNDDPRWHLAAHELTDAAGERAVIVRFYYETEPDGFATQEGHAIDDVAILP